MVENFSNQKLKTMKSREFDSVRNYEFKMENEHYFEWRMSPENLLKVLEDANLVMKGCKIRITNDNNIEISKSW